MLIYSCCVQQQAGTVPPPAPLAELLVENLEAATGCYRYRQSTEQDEYFLLPLLPGIPFATSELSFAALPGNELFGITEETDKAYRFARLSGRLWLCDSLVRETALKLSDIAEGDLTLDTYTSATYGDEFQLAIPALPLRDTAEWGVQVVRERIRADTLRCRHKTRLRHRIMYRFSARLIRLPVTRCWVKQPVTFKSPPGQGRYAMVNELLIVRDFTLSCPEAKGSMHASSPLIVGMLCTLLPSKNVDIYKTDLCERKRTAAD